MSVPTVYIDLDNDTDLEQSTDTESDTGEGDKSMSGHSDIQFDHCSDFEANNCLNYSNDIQSKSTDRMSEDSDHEFIDWCDFPRKSKLNSDLKSQTKSSTTVPKSSYFNEDFGEEVFKTNVKSVRKKELKEELKSLKTDINGKDGEKCDLNSVLELYNSLQIDKRVKQIPKKDIKSGEDLLLEKSIFNDNKTVEKRKKSFDKLVISDVHKDVDKSETKKVDKIVIKKSLCSKKVEYNSRKSVDKEVKDNVFVPTPSTSREEPITHLPLRSVEMRDQSTDPRFYCRPYNACSTLAQSSIASNEDTTATNTSPEVQKIWVFVCLNCRQKFESRPQFSEHHTKVHSGDVKRFLKTEKHLLDLNESSVRKKKKKSKHRSKNLLESGLNSVPKTKSKTKSKETINGLVNYKTKKSKNKTNKSDATVGNSASNPYPDPVSSPKVYAMSHYRLAQKCKICSFTPLINSMESVRDHIQKEHHIPQANISEHHLDVMVKCRPRIH